MALQLRDALRAYVPATKAVRTLGFAAEDRAVQDLHRHLSLLDGVDVHPVPDGEPPSPDVLLVAAFPADDREAQAALGAALAAAAPGATVAVMLDRPVLAAPWPRLLDLATAADCQVLD